MLLGSSLSSCGPDLHQWSCESLTKLASDREKIGYAKDWIVSHLENPEFRESLRKRHSFEHGDERYQKYGSLDWKYLGLLEGMARLEFNMDTASPSGWDINRIYSASLSQGRASLIIDLSPEAKLDPMWTPPDHETKQIGDGLFLWCAHGGYPD